MPIYEYRCGNCKRRVSIFFRSFSTATEPRCPNCDSDQLTRLVSRVAQVKSEDARLDVMSDPSQFGDVDENDPKSVARWAKKMGKELGEDLGDDFDQVMEEAMEEEASGGGGEPGGGADLGDDL